MLDLWYLRVNYDDCDIKGERNGLGYGLKNKVSDWLGFDSAFCMTC